MRAILLWLAVLLCGLAWWSPAPVLPRHVFDGIVFLDVTQSMNTLDGRGGGTPIGRLAYAKLRLRDALARLPCGSRVGWGIFTEYRSVVLLLPVEVCANYGELTEALERIDGSMAWSGGSEIARGLMAALRTSAHLPERPAVVFVTDGHEAPPLRPDFVVRVPDDAAGMRGIIVGVGGDELRPIPKIGPGRQDLGFWGPQDVMQAPPVFSSDPQSTRDAAAAAEGTEHLSSLKQDHLQQLAALTSMRYVRLTPATDLARELRSDSVGRALHVPVPLRSVLTLAALAALLAATARPLLRVSRT